MDNEPVFKSEMAISLYEAYEEFLSIPDFSGHKTIDAMNYMAEKLEKKGYMIPTTGYCVNQAYYVVCGLLARFVRENTKDGKFDADALTDRELRIFKGLTAAFTVLETVKKNGVKENG